jgi:Leucine-rich repeat (LRR) protein
VGGTSAGDVQFNNSIPVHGRIAVDLELSPDLNTIDLAYNLLTGWLPESIGHWTELKTFRVSFNRLSGSLPESIEQWNNLETIDLSCCTLECLLASLNNNGMSSSPPSHVGAPSPQLPCECGEPPRWLSALVTPET